MELLVFLLVFILILGLVYWVAAQVLPPPFPVVILGVGLIILVLYLAGGAADFNHR